MPRARLRIGQSADPDDAFMAWGLARALEARDLECELHFDDIESLNRSALRGDLDLAAISVGAYPALADEYRLLRCGASFGDAYGPVVIGRHAPPAPGPEAVAGLRVAIPGAHTSARLLLGIYAGGSFEEVEMPFDAIMDAVTRAEVDAGLIIHEGQLVFADQGFHALFEPAAEWARREDLPVPLGAVAIRRDLDRDVQRDAAEAFLHGVHAAFAAPEEAFEFAGRYARGLSRELLEEYVHRFVNAATLDMGERGIRAIERLLERAHAAGLVSRRPEVDPL